MANADIVVKVKADASGVQAGLRPLTTGLANVEQAAKEADSALAKLDAETVDISVNEQAIGRARAEIVRLQDQIAEDIAIGADTRPAQRRIAELSSAIKKLQSEPISMSMDVDVDTGGAQGALDALTQGVAQFSDELAGSLGKFGGKGGIIGTAIAGFGAVSIGLGKMAADVETTKLQFEGLTGSAEEAQIVFDDIKAFADTTPFEFADLSSAGKKLIAFGVDSRDVVPTLKLLGEAAAATGTSVEDLAVIYGQMLAKGKVSNEELLQFTERGIPAYALLAEQLGVTVEEVQDLASEGKLGADAVKALGQNIGNAFKGSIAAQADSFNGKMSTLKDSFTAMGQNLGTAFLPALTKVVDLITLATKPFSALAGFISDTNDRLTTFSNAAQDAGGPLGVVADVLGFVGIGGDDAAEGADAAADGIVHTGEAAADAAPEVKTFEEQMKDLEGALQDAEGALSDANDEFERFLSITGNERELQDRFTESLIAFGDALKENGLTFEDNTQAAIDNRDALRTIADNADAIIGSFDPLTTTVGQVKSTMEDLRRQFVLAAEQMGLSAQDANELADAYGLIPDQVATQFQITGIPQAQADVRSAQTAIANLPKSVTIGISVRPSIDKNWKKLLEQELKGTRLTGGITALASGGPMFPGSPYLVGERGAELVFPGISSMVIANEQLRKAIAAGTKPTHINPPPSTVINVTVSGAMDPVATGRQITRTLDRYRTASGYGA